MDGDVSWEEAIPVVFPYFMVPVTDEGYPHAVAGDRCGDGYLENGIAT